MSGRIIRNVNEPFTSYQMEFLAEDEPITIIPNFKMEELVLLSNIYGPFVPALPTEVPLWLAITLKKKKKCKIQYPMWLSIEQLTFKYNRENSSTKSFEYMHPHFIEISNLLLTVAPDDCPENVNTVRGLVEDLCNRRQSKWNDTFISGMQDLKSLDTVISTNLTAMEVNRVRTTVCQGLNHLQNILNADQSNSRSSGSSGSSLPSSIRR